MQVHLRASAFVMKMNLDLALGGRKVGYSDPNLDYTKLLMGMDSGINTSQLFIDESPIARTGMTFAGAAQISTTQEKFGPSSLYLDGFDDFVRWPDSDDWYFGTGEFTIDLWLRPVVHTNVRAIINQADNINAGAVGSSWALWTFNGVLYFDWYDADIATWREITGGTALSTSAWTHVRVDRDATGKVRLYKAGAMVASYAYAGEFRQIAQSLNIGIFTDGSGDYNGYMDEIRILKGVAACGSDSGYTPPTAAYART
jgi:hypothetical protein